MAVSVHELRLAARQSLFQEFLDSNATHFEWSRDMIVINWHIRALIDI